MSDPIFPYACVLGNPVSHSLSPIIFDLLSKYYGTPLIYEALKVLPAELKQSLKNLSKWGAVGCNITLPYKNDVLKIVDSIDDEVKAIGAANVIKLDRKSVV